METSQDVARGVRQVLESLQRAGVTHLPRFSGGNIAAARESEAREGEAPAQPQRTIRREPHAPEMVGAPGASSSQGGRVGGLALPSENLGPPGNAPSPSASASAKSLLDDLDSERLSAAPELSTQEKLSQLQVLQAEVAGCTRCKELADTRTQTVFGVGSADARLVFLGEAPGADEDAQGEPFVGRAGQLLTDMITKGMKLAREDVYILNVLKCRPPGNRNPNPNEVINCKGFLEKQLEIIQPEFICCLGSVAAKALLNTEQSIGRLRKKWHEYRGIPVICTYHPAYLLRNPAAKRDVWEDLQLLMMRMGLPVKM
jgi:DNA polymerase